MVRRELSDNYCFYVPNYDSIDACYDWAKETLNKHRNDPREHVYTLYVHSNYCCHLLLLALGLLENNHASWVRLLMVIITASEIGLQPSHSWL